MADQHRGFEPPRQPNPYAPPEPHHPAGTTDHPPLHPAGSAAQPPAQPGYPTAPGWPVDRRSKRPFIIAALGVLAFALIGLGGFVVYDEFIKEDPGIALCKALRDNRDKAMDSDGDDKLSEEEYKAIREKLDESDYEDIRKHGKALVDLSWQMSNTSDESGAGALVFIGQIAEHATGLQSACADQGIIVNLMDE